MEGAGRTNAIACGALGAMGFLGAIWLQKNRRGRPKIDDMERVEELELEPNLGQRFSGWLENMGLLRGHGHLRVNPVHGDLVVEKDVEVPMGDGARLRCNVFLPRAAAAAGEGGEDSRVPALLHCVPYSKDETCKRGVILDTWGKEYMVVKLLLSGSIGEVELSEGTPWEAADPNVWCRRGYAVVQCDSRGFGKSDGGTADAPASILSAAEAHDYAEVIAWVASRPWCTGRVGTTGVSYLAMSQWSLLSYERPPALKACCIWEGHVDPVRHFVNVGGAGPSLFSTFWFSALKLTVNKATKRGGKDAHDLAYLGAGLAAMAQGRGAYDAAPRLCDLSRIVDRLGENVDTSRTALLVCGSWSDMGVHNPGTFAGWEALRDKDHAFLYTHGRDKWATFYSDEAVEAQAAFFDAYLKGDDDKDGARRAPLPPVRLETRVDGADFVVRDEPEFPIPREVAARVALDFLPDGPGGGDAVLEEGGGRPQSKAACLALKSGAAVFEAKPFEATTEVTGYGALDLTITLRGAAGRAAPDDAVITVRVQKLAGPDKRVCDFAGSLGNEHAGVAVGFLRASHAATLDAAKSTPLRPFYRHDAPEPLVPGTKVDLRVPLPPSSTLFERGDALRVTVATRNLIPNYALSRASLRKVNDVPGADLLIDLDSPPTLVLPTIPSSGPQ